MALAIQCLVWSLILAVAAVVIAAVVPDVSYASPVIFVLFDSAIVVPCATCAVLCCAS